MTPNIPQSNIASEYYLIRIGNIEIVASLLEDTIVEYRYIDLESRKEVLRVKDYQKDDLMSVIEFDQDFWDTNLEKVALKTPSKLLVLVSARLLHITPTK